MINTKQIAENLKKLKGRKFIVILGICGIMIIFLSDILSGDDRSEEGQVTESQTISGYEDYAAGMQSQLSDILEKIDGVGKADVMMTFSGTEEYVYAQEEKLSSDSGRVSQENKYTVISGSSGKEALLCKVENPEITGIVVVCEGGDSNIVKEKVINAVSAAFGISSSKIFVAKAK